MAPWGSTEFRCRWWKWAEGPDSDGRGCARTGSSLVNPTTHKTPTTVAIATLNTNGMSLQFT